MVTNGGGGIGVFIRCPAAMRAVVRTKLVPGDDIIDTLCAAVDEALKFDV
jgi:hypothetical protein